MSQKVPEQSPKGRRRTGLISTHICIGATYLSCHLDTEEAEGDACAVYGATASAGQGLRPRRAGNGTYSGAGRRKQTRGLEPREAQGST